MVTAQKRDFYFHPYWEATGESKTQWYDNQYAHIVVFFGRKHLEYNFLRWRDCVKLDFTELFVFNSSRY